MAKDLRVWNLALYASRLLIDVMRAIVLSLSHGFVLLVSLALAACSQTRIQRDRLDCYKRTRVAEVGLDMELPEKMAFYSSSPKMVVVGIHKLDSGAPSETIHIIEISVERIKKESFYKKSSTQGFLDFNGWYHEWHAELALREDNGVCSIRKDLDYSNDEALMIDAQILQKYAQEADLVAAKRIINSVKLETQQKGGQAP